MQKKHFPALSLDDLDRTHGGVWPLYLLARLGGSTLGGQLAGGFGSIPNDIQELGAYRADEGTRAAEASVRATPEDPPEVFDEEF